MTPSPFKPLTQALVVKNPAAARLPRTYIYCTQTGAESLDLIAARVRAEGWRYYEVEADHMAMVTAPKAVAAILLEITATPGLPSSSEIG